MDDDGPGHGFETAIVKRDFSFMFLNDFKTQLFHPTHFFFDTQIQLWYNLLVLSLTEDEEIDDDGPG